MYLQFQPVVPKASRAICAAKTSFFGIAHAGGVGQKLDTGMLYVYQHIVFLVVQFNAFHATVTISVPDARIDCSITSSELNFRFLKTDGS